MKMDLFDTFSNTDLISNCSSIFNQNSGSASNMQLPVSDYGHSNESSNRSYQYGNPRSLSASDLFTPSVFVTIPLQNSSPTTNHNNGCNSNINNSANNNDTNLEETNLNTHYTNHNYITNSNKNGSEIKSEPIKVELSENNQHKDKSASTVSIISSTIITSHSNNSKNNNQAGESIKCKTNLLPLPSSNSLLVTARPKKSVICYKCDKCPFISISQNCLNQHYEHNHKEQEFINNTSKKLTCPGCDNIFYIRKSLETHLLNDHQMNINEIETLLSSLLDGASTNLDGTQSNVEGNEIDSRNLVVVSKNRISIKNVKILQNPNLINSNELFNDTFGNTGYIGESTASSNCNQKIYLKNPIYLLNNNNTNKIYEQSLLPSLHLSSTTSSSSSFDSLFNDQNFIEMGHNPDVPIEDALPDQNNYIIDLNGNSNSNNNVNITSDDKQSLIVEEQQQLQNNNGLHLRTVDELNLLDLNDVENNFLLNSNRQTPPNSDNHSDEVALLNQCDILTHANVLDTATNSDDNFIFIEPENDMDQTGYEHDENDDNINFVCAEEIINENQFDNDFGGATVSAMGNMYMDCDKTEVSKKNRGRPKGSKQRGITQLKKTSANLTAKEIGYKCSIAKCAMRFNSQDVLLYHEKCHSATNPDVIICPVCANDDQGWNWDTLHTHLWRYHNIDMELYSCTLCSFKTPILSRLNNTHIKIHSTERNFKCDQCDKAFKNAKQLKNHRRLHRLNNQMINNDYKKCSKCTVIFKDAELLKTHIEQTHNRNTTQKNTKEIKYMCPHCNKVTTSNANLKLHVLIHMENKKFKCDKKYCCYSTSDHNAFRRHKMRHNPTKRYKCSFCKYTCIQSTTFKNHILKNHASKATDLVFQCKSCTFVTINKQKYTLHMQKHETSSCDLISNITDKFIDDSSNFIDLEELDVENISHDETSCSDSPNNSDNILLTATTLDQPLIRPAVFANTFSNIENFKFTKLFDLHDKFDTVNFSNIYDDTINYNQHLQSDDQSDHLSTVVPVHRILNDSFDSDKDCFNIDLT